MLYVALLSVPRLLKASHLLLIRVFVNTYSCCLSIGAASYSFLLIGFCSSPLPFTLYAVTERTFYGVVIWFKHVSNFGFSSSTHSVDSPIVGICRIVFWLINLVPSVQRTEWLPAIYRSQRIERSLRAVILALCSYFWTSKKWCKEVSGLLPS